MTNPQSLILRCLTLGFVAIALAFGAISSANHKHHKHEHTPHLKVGDRVFLSNDDKPKPTAVNPKTWKLVSMNVEAIATDGSRDSISVKMLLPPEWFEEGNVRVGSRVPLPLELEDSGLDEGLFAKVDEIEPCPPISEGPGRVVLATYNHEGRNVCELTFTMDGRTETLKQVGNHRYFSLDADDWALLRNVKKGEKLRGLGSTVMTVVSCRPLGVSERVYDLAVEGDSVYHTGLHRELVSSHAKPLPQTPQQSPQPPPTAAKESAPHKTERHAPIPDRVWTRGISGDRLDNAREHWEKHRRDFPQLKNEKEYIQFAYDFVQTAPMKKKRSNGDTVCFDPKTRYFAITDKFGVMRTCFKCSGTDYFNRQ